MSPEIDDTRQRTVAELLAEHGGADGGERRRRRRDGHGPQRPVPPPAPGPAVPMPPPPGRGAQPGRMPLRDQGPRRPDPPYDPQYDPAPPGRRGPPPARPTGPAAHGAGRQDRPTEMTADRRRRSGDPGQAGPN